MKNQYTLLIVLFLLISVNGFSQIISASFENAQTGPVPHGTMDAPIVKIKIVNGTLPVNFESMIYNTAYSTSFISDVATVKLYATDTNAVFSTSNPFFSPTWMGGTFIFNVPIALSSGDNYFWLTFDIRPTAVAGHCVAAYIDSLYFSGNVALSPVSNLNFDNCIKIGNPVLAINDPSVQAPQIKLYPNPANDFIAVNNISLLDKNIAVKISDVFGNLVLQQQLVGNAHGETILISSLNSGVYVAEIKSADKTYYQRFIKN